MIINFSIIKCAITNKKLNKMYHDNDEIIENNTLVSYYIKYNNLVNVIRDIIINKTNIQKKDIVTKDDSIDKITLHITFDYYIYF